MDPRKEPGAIDPKQAETEKRCEGGGTCVVSKER